MAGPLTVSVGDPDSPVQLLYLPLELASLASVRSFVTAFRALGLPLHTLLLNAGVMALPQRQLSEDGHEYQLGVNHLGHFLLANLLLDALVAAAVPEDPGRVIVLSSSAHLIPSPLQRGDLSDLQCSRSSYSPWRAYGQSKLANLLFAYELDRRCRSLGLPIAANAVHPGAVDTELPRHLGGTAPGGAGQAAPITEDQGAEDGLRAALRALSKPILDLIVKRPEVGARTSVLLATQDEGKLSGRYWQDERPSASLDVERGGLLPAPIRALLRVLLPPGPEPTSYNPATWAALWAESERLVRLQPSESPVSDCSGPSSFA